jgi:hypothetical protein
MSRCSIRRQRMQRPHWNQGDIQSKSNSLRNATGNPNPGKSPRTVSEGDRGQFAFTAPLFGQQFVSERQYALGVTLDAFNFFLRNNNLAVLLNKQSDAANRGRGFQCQYQSHT